MSKGLDILMRLRKGITCKECGHVNYYAAWANTEPYCWKCSYKLE